MTGSAELHNIQPRTGDEKLVARLRELHSENWPANLYRFARFSLSGEGDKYAYIAVAWDPVSRALYVQEVTLGMPPPACRLPKRVNVDDEGWLSRVTAITAAVRPDYMNLPLASVPPSMLSGLQRRKMIVDALLMVDAVGAGREFDYIVNDFIFFDPEARQIRVAEICAALGKSAGYQSSVLKLLTRFIWYGGDQRALLARTPDRGGPGKDRPEPARKPGPLSKREKLDRAAARAKGKVYVRRAKRIDERDLADMKEGLAIDWVGNQVSLATTRTRLLERHPENRRTAFSYRRLRYHGAKIIAANDFVAKRYGRHATAQYLTPRPGTSSELTQGILEILDIDGFRPKAPIGALVEGKLVPIDVWVVFAVSRLSGAVRGYEICLEGEEAEGYRRCLVSALLPLDDRVKSLGLDPLPGLLTGNFDGVFVDNGPGKAKSVRRATTESIPGIMFNPPGARPDLKPFVERFNGIIISLMAEETDQGYTRANNVLEKRKRRKRTKGQPLSIRELEIFILFAMDEFNQTADREKLRPENARIAGYGISPSEIHRYHQGRRVGQGARIRAPDEVYDIFLPWEPAACRDGRVEYKKARYSSTKLTEIATAHAMSHQTKTLPLMVKRVSRDCWPLLCKLPDNDILEIEMIDEDKNRFGKSTTWKEMEVANIDVVIRREGLEQKSTVIATERQRSARRVNVRQQGDLDDVESARGNPYGGAVGPTKSKAKQNGAASRERALGERQRVAYGLSNTTNSSEDAGPVWEMDDDDDPLAEAARRAEEEYRLRK
ncbi:hypothetical protein [Paraburkholderia nemoris]|uniref:hypothetical protein n=1 Tax=Paraburkholderia nemoris TaxID=2793076 RepID=UPI001B120FF5|nr:hypothetical protein [Paraburkholderia nemoris]CAE6851415.1 hypothetical protein R75777_07563 [Paraburkholderia nemoris]